MNDNYSLNLNRVGFVIAEDIGTGEASKVSQIITKKKISPGYILKKARSSRLELSCLHGSVLVITLLQKNNSGRYRWRLSLIPTSFLETTAS